VASSYNAEARTFSLKFRFCSYQNDCFYTELNALPLLDLLLIQIDLIIIFSSQEIPPTPGQPTKEATFIPVVVGLLDSSGKDIILSSVYHDGTQQAISSSSTILRLTKLSQESFFKPICNLTIFVLCVYKISFMILCFAYITKEERVCVL